MNKFDADGLVPYSISTERALREVDDFEHSVAVAASLPIPRLGDLTVLFLAHGITGEPRVEVRGPSAEFERGVHDWVWNRLVPLRRAATAVSGLRGALAPFWDPGFPGPMLRRQIEDGELLASASALGVRSLIVVPLATAGRIIGALAIARLNGREAASPGDAATALMLGRRAARALEHTRALQTVRSMAAQQAYVGEAMVRWQRVFERAPWGAAIVDPDGWRIEAGNIALARMHGYAGPDQLMGLPATELVPPDERSGFLARLTGLRGEPLSYEAVHQRTDGQTFPALITLHPAPAMDEPGRHLTLHVQDLTTLKNTEARLRRAERMEAIGRLAGGVAHEINNMMTVVLGFSDLVIASQELSPPRRQELGQVWEAAARAAHISQQLLAFSRRQPVQPTLFEVDAVVTDTLQLLRPLVPPTVRVSTELGLPGGVVLADRGQIEQVLLNLAFNARDAMPDGGELVVATARRELSGAPAEAADIPPGCYAVLSVRDTGIGMDADTLRHLFEPFFTTKEVGAGTGLGLATVFGIVQQSGGSVWAESTLGAGATFTFCLPLVDRPASAAAPRGQVPGGSERVLVVEDEAAVRDIACRILRDRGYNVLAAENGVAALALLERDWDAVDIVLSDVLMPVMNGRDLLQRMRAARPDLPMLFMSGFPGSEMIERGLLVQSDAFLQKPFDAAALAGRVREVLDAARSAILEA